MGNEEPKPQPPPGNASDKLFDATFEFQMMAKQMAREKAKAEKESKAAIDRVKKCIAKGDYEQAKVNANDAIRQKNMVKRYGVLSSKVSTISQRLKQAYQNQMLSEKMESLTKQLLGAGNVMDVVKMTETMQNFEKLFDDMDVNTAVTDQVLDNINAGTVNEDEVNQLIGQIAQQNGMKLSEEFEGIQIGGEQIKENPQAEQIGAGGFPMA